MLKEGIIDSLYAKRVSPAEFNFESMTVPSLYNYISEYEIGKIYDIITSIKYSSQLTKKKDAIKQILGSWGFVPFASGTNRMCFRYLENKNFIVKVPYKESGLDNGYREYMNQMLIKPFVAKTFDVHPSGAISQHEKVLPITNREEYMSVIEDVFAMLTAIIGKCILDDVGTKYFMNIGIRSGFGVVILDYPDVFEVDGKKLFCNRPVFPNTKFPVCGGLIDYDAGFNTLICKTCGKEYSAASLRKDKDNKLVIIEGESFMKVRMLVNGNVIAESDDNITNTIEKPVVKKQKVKRPKVSNPSIFVRGEMERPVVVEEYVEEQPTNTQKIKPTSRTIVTQESAAEEPKQQIYSDEQVNAWIGDLMATMKLSDEVLITAEKTLESDGKSFNMYNKDELEVFLHNVQMALNARYAKNKASSISKSLDMTMSKENKEDEDPVYNVVESDEDIQEDTSAYEQVEEGEPADDDQDPYDYEEYASVYVDGDSYHSGTMSEEDKARLMSVCTNNNNADVESFSTGNDLQRDKQKNNDAKPINIKPTFIKGSDASQY